MTKEEILKTQARERISGEIGTKKVAEIEDMILKGSRTDQTIVETSVREQLRKQIGKNKLEKIEADLLAGEI